MNIPIKILIAEHDPADIELLEHYLKKGNINCITLAAQTLNKIEDSLRNFKPDIILSDYNHPSFSGMDVFKLKQTVSPHIPFIFVSGAIGEENAIECIRQGVTDYALKDKLFTLPVKISRALHEAAEKRQKAKIEKELQQSEMNLRAIFNNTDTGFLLLDNIYNIVSYNLKASYFTKIMFGTEISSEQNFISLVPTVRKEEFVSIIEKIIDGETVDTETHYSQTDGITNWFRINGKPVFNRAGNVTNVSLAVYDITDSKRSQIKLNNIVKELTEKNNELQKTNIELDKFVYSTSHDLRAPLLSLIGLIEMCSDYKDQHDKLDNLFSMMITSINRVDESIKNILGFSRNKKTEIKPEPLDIKQITFEIIDGLRFTKNNKEINYIVNIDSENIFYSDKSRITSIINNLISNAAKYQREKEPEPFIKFSFSINKSEASIIVEDNGEGIPKDMQTRIFDMFIRASVHSSGSGLGLYICREMVEKLGGNIQLISEPDKGSIFIVRLPILMPQTIQYADSPVYR